MLEMLLVQMINNTFNEDLEKLTICCRAFYELTDIATPLFLFKSVMKVIKQNTIKY